MPLYQGHCGDHEELVSMVKDIHHALIGSADPEGVEGLVSKVRRHERVIKSIDRMMWMVIGTVVAAGVAAALQCYGG